MLKKLLLLYILVLPFSGALSSIVISGYPILTLYNLFITVVSIFKILKKKKGIHFYLLLLGSFIITVLYSTIIGWPFKKTITNSVMYYLPFIIYPYLENTKISLSELLRVLIIGLSISGVISVMSGAGLIEGALQDATGAVLNVFFVDGAAGIYALMLGIYLLSKTDYNRTVRLQGLLCLLIGLIILIYYQSRGRAIIAASLSLLMILLIFLALKQKKRLFMVVIAMIVAVLVIFRNEELQFYIERLFGRISNTSFEEDNVSYRLAEVEEYWKMFKENPIFGGGWGVLLNDMKRNSFNLRYNAHNMYFGMLGVTGLSFAPILILNLIALLCKNIKDVFTRRSVESVWSLCCIIAVMLLGIANAGFGKLFTQVFMITVYVIQLENQRKRI